MKIARELERRLEAMLDGIAGRIFRGDLHPSEMVARIAREAELAEFESVAGPATANSFQLSIHPSNLAGVGGNTNKLTMQLARAFSELAADRGWRLEGPVTVQVVPEEAIPPGTVRCQATVLRGRLKPWAYLVGDRQLPIGPNRCLLGRGADSDIVLDSAQVSRHHAVIFRQDGQAYAVDLDSANGTAINGTAVGRIPAKLDEGFKLALAGLDFLFTRDSRLAPRGSR
ncbi:MAG TPA: FhaA domain-containing protein [Acidimicrobiia bacterium]|nr:FhaA domain-containing protein [Acidimicrobiia bacterium]